MAGATDAGKLVRASWVRLLCLLLFVHMVGKQGRVWARDQESNALLWRFDGRCGSRVTLPEGGEAECDARSDRPCCSDYGYCGNSPSHCTCQGCKDFRRDSTPKCYTRLEGTEGQLQSPHYPRPFPPRQDCCYDIQRIDQSEYCGVRFFVEDFDIAQGPNDKFCLGDWLAIYSCVPTGGSRICGNQSGMSFQYPFQPDATAFRLHFHSDVTSSGGRFRIRYRLITDCTGLFYNPPVSAFPASTNTPCYTKIENRKGTFNTPYYPKKYPANLDCVYEFVRTNPFVCGIMMRSINFELEPPINTPFGGACSDFFHTPTCGFLCGKLNFTWVVNYQPGATSLKFHFHSDESFGFDGFFVTFQQVYECK